MKPGEAMRPNSTDETPQLVSLSKYSDESSLAYSESRFAPRLDTLIKAFVCFNIVYFLIVFVAVSGHSRAEPAVFFVLNGSLVLVKTLILLSLGRAIRRGSKFACGFVTAAAIIGVIYVVFTFKPGRDYVYLGLEGFQYVVNVLNLLVGVTAALFSAATLRDFRSRSQGEDHKRVASTQEQSDKE